jgi:hypothetical protein
MVDREELMKEARRDVDICLKIWSVILEEYLGDSLSYAYAKGSCVKKWDNPIDYAPLLSDVDVHVSTTDGEKPGVKKSVREALQCSERYEDLFKSERPDHVHLPRMQIIGVDALINSTEIEYVPPKLESVKVLYGKPKQEPIPADDTIRQIDRRSIERQEEFLLPLPYRLFDRTGLDFWGMLRCGGFGWRVAPSPYRLLSQRYPEPIEVWSWNRTKVCEELSKMGYQKISKLYTSFYDNCWKIFLSDFKDSKAFRDVIIDGYGVLNECLIEVRKI